MSGLKDGGPAFPVLCDYVNGKPRGMQTANSGGWHEGLSLRDYFAAAALQGLNAGDFANYSDMAFDAFKIADAMLEARRETKCSQNNNA